MQHRFLLPLLLLILCITIYTSAVSVMAEPQKGGALPAPGFMSSSPFYALDLFFENVSLALARSDIEKAYLMAENYKERLAETQASLQKNDPLEAEKSYILASENKQDIQTTLANITASSIDESLLATIENQITNAETIVQQTSSAYAQQVFSKANILQQKMLESMDAVTIAEYEAEISKLTKITSLSVVSGATVQTSPTNQTTTSAFQESQTTVSDDNQTNAADKVTVVSGKKETTYLIPQSETNQKTTQDKKTSIESKPTTKPTTTQTNTTSNTNQPDESNDDMEEQEEEIEPDIQNQTTHLPDLYIENAVFIPTQQGLRFQYTIKNQGEAGTNNISPLVITWDNGTQESVYASQAGLTAGGSYTSPTSQNYITPPPGTTHAILEIDPNNIVHESDDGNNLFDLSVPSPMLYIENASLQQEKPGSKVSLSFSVINAGDAWGLGISTIEYIFFTMNPKTGQFLFKKPHTVTIPVLGPEEQTEKTIDDLNKLLTEEGIDPTASVTKQIYGVQIRIPGQDDKNKTAFIEQTEIPPEEEPAQEEPAPEVPTQEEIQIEPEQIIDALQEPEPEEPIPEPEPEPEEEKNME